MEHALEFVGITSKGGDATVLDIGTGSGCIAVTMAKLSPSLRVVAVDCSPDALVVARLNAERHGVVSQITFIQADLFEPFFSSKLPAIPYALLVSNPPYISRHEWEGLQREVRDFEPALALITPEGSECYRAISAMAPSLLLPGGKLCFELHAERAAEVSEIMTDHGFKGITVLKDYASLDRIISGVIC